MTAQKKAPPAAPPATPKRRHPELAAIPATPAGFERLNIDPLFWDGSGVLFGGLVNVEMTRGLDGAPATVLVVVPLEACGAVDLSRRAHRVDALETGVRVDAPELLRLAPLSQDPDHVKLIRVQLANDGGRTVHVVELSNDAQPRSNFKPRGKATAAAPATSATTPALPAAAAS